MVQAELECLALPLPTLVPKVISCPGVVPVAKAWSQRILLDLQKPDKLDCTSGKSGTLFWL